MYTADNYFWGLVGYYIGALIVLWYCYWLLRRVVYGHIRNVLVMLFAALLLTPVQAYSESNLAQLAPAFLVYLFEGVILGTEQDPTRALIPMGFVFVLLLLAYGAWLWWQHNRNQQTNQGADTEAGEPNDPEHTTVQSSDSLGTG